MSTRRMIDLRSDTVTKPDARMRKAMADAEVGDDVYREDPTIRVLERRAAEMFGREAALFVPSGTMGNLLAIHTHAERGQEVVCERLSHVYNYELSGMSSIAGVMPRVVIGVHGLMSWERIEPEIHPLQDHRAKTGLICLENTHNMAGGTVMTAAQTRAICDEARKQALPVHLDGARVFNAAAALGTSVAELTAAVDSVMFCFSKGLGAPVGSALVGGREFIEKARRTRKALGGGMRQAGVLAAAALVALEDSPALLPADHARARRLAEALAELPGVAIDPAAVVTNIVIFDVAETGMDAWGAAARLVANGAMCSPVDKTRVRLVTHRDINDDDIDFAIEGIRKALGGK